MASPGIELHVDGDSVRVVDRRADITPLLQSLPVGRAISLIPRLLPICGAAQRIAAERAVEAARLVVESSARQRSRERELLREQGLACAWRLLVDWPRIVGKESRTQELNCFRKLKNPQLGEALEGLLPDLCDLQSLEELIAWADRRHCVGAEVVSTALERRAAHRESTLAMRLLDGEQLWDEALPRLGAAGANTAIRSTPTQKDAICVGALAMRRHALVDAIAPRIELPAQARLLLAMLLDTLALAAALRDAPLPHATVQQPLVLGAVGRADTARGPLFHHVVLDSQDRVEHWAVLAPTDWHLAPGGLLERLLAEPQPTGDYGISVQAVDPCAPWHVGSPAEEAAHA